MSKEPLEAEPQPLEAESLPDGADASMETLESSTVMTGPPPGVHPEERDDRREWAMIIGAVLVVFLLLFWGQSAGWFEDEDDEPIIDEPPVLTQFQWGEPVWLPRIDGCVDEGNGQDFPEYAIGYEPSIAADPDGNLYYTAHKDLRWSSPDGGIANWLDGEPHIYPDLPCVQDYYTTWDYYASWFFVSRDGGQTWNIPADWGVFNEGMQYVGDEGDIGVDGNGRVFFVDTTLEDNWLHAWEDGGTNHIVSQRLQSTAADDRPWLTAQGDGIVHYLGNNGVPLPAPPLSPGTSGFGRYWYYRGVTVADTNGHSVVFDQGRGLEGGWAHITAEENGDHVYIAQEVNNGGTGGIKVWASDDTGLTWNDPVWIGPMNGTHPEGYPWMGVGENGTVFVAWQESTQGGRAPGVLYIARSDEYGAEGTWEYWDISAGHPHPDGAVYLYPNLEVGPGNLVAYTYYGNNGSHSVGDTWHLYASALLDPQPGEIFDFVMVDDYPLHTSDQREVDIDDLHPLHDLFEVVISSSDLSINIAYQYNIGDHHFEENEEQRYLMFLRVNGWRWMMVMMANPRV